MMLMLLFSALVTTGASFGSQQAQANDPPQIRAGFEALRRGDVDAAIAEAESEIRRRPSAAAQELLGAALIQKRQWDRAEEALKRAKGLDPQRLGPLLWLGQLLLHANRLPEAEENFKAAFALSPRESAAVRGLAGVSLRRGNFGQAIAILEDGLRQSGGRDDEVKTLLATLYYELGQLDRVERIVGHPCARSAGCLLLGLTRLEQGRRDEALTLLDSAAKESRDSSWAIVARGVALRLRRQPRQGVSDLEQAAKRQPDWPFIPRELGEMWLMDDDIPKALASFEQGIRIAPDSVMARVRVARSLLAHAQREHALRAVELAPGEGPRSSASALALAGMYTRLGQTGKAESLLRQSATQFPKDPRVAYELGVILTELKRDQEAVAPLTIATRLSPKWADPLMRLAEIQARRGERQQALATAERAVKLVGEGPMGTLFVGSIHEQLRNLPAAEAAYRKALQQDPKFAPAALKIADLAEQRGKPDEARAVLEGAAARTSSALPWLQLALLHERQGREGEAITAYRAAIDRDPQNLLALNNLAWLLGKHPQQLKDAIALAERAYQGAPDSAAVCDTLGWLLAEAGELGRGLALLRKAVALEPENPTSRYRLAVILAKRGDRSEAIAELRRALASRPFPEAEAARRTLETLQDTVPGSGTTPESKSEPTRRP